MTWATAVRKRATSPSAPKLVSSDTLYRPKLRTAEVDWDRLVSLDFETYYDCLLYTSPSPRDS